MFQKEGWRVFKTTRSYTKASVYINRVTTSTFVVLIFKGFLYFLNHELNGFCFTFSIFVVTSLPLHTNPGNNFPFSTLYLQILEVAYYRLQYTEKLEIFN